VIYETILVHNVRNTSLISVNRITLSCCLSNRVSVVTIYLYSAELKILILSTFNSYGCSGQVGSTFDYIPLTSIMNNTINCSTYLVCCTIVNM
jgi:hypothetical protein